MEFKGIEEPTASTEQKSEIRCTNPSCGRLLARVSMKGVVEIVCRDCKTMTRREQ